MGDAVILFDAKCPVSPAENAAAAESVTLSTLFHAGSVEAEVDFLEASSA